jgi:hypothetical protein
VIGLDAAGVASSCRVKSSQLQAPSFQTKLRERARQIRCAPQAPTTCTKDPTFMSAA